MRYEKKSLKHKNETENRQTSMQQILLNKITRLCIGI